MKEIEALEILKEKYMDMECYFAENDCYPEGYDADRQEAIAEAVKALSEVEKYRSIGTVEECRKTVEKQKAIKPTFEMNFGDFESRFSCECGKKIVVRHDRGVMDNHDGPNYCSNCGKKWDWGDTT